MKIAFIESPRLGAQAALQQLRNRYGQADLSEADYIVAVGGDGTVLRALYAGLSAHGRPVFAMRGEGSLGYLCNRYAADDLHRRLVAARRLVLRPLEARIDVYGKLEQTAISFNEIVLLRQRLQAAKLIIASSVREAWPPLVGDGLLITTPVGSSGYNRSQGGPRLPLESGLLAVTGLAVHHTSDWTNVVISDREEIRVEVIDPVYRPVRLETSDFEVPDVARARISLSARSAVLVMEGG
jgi:NAD+ kinase